MGTTNCHPNSKREIEKTNLLRDFDNYLLDHTSASQATRIYNIIQRNCDNLYTREDFIRYFMDDSVYVYGLGKMSLKLVRDFLGISKTVTVVRDSKIDKEVYRDYLLGAKIIDLCAKYKLQSRVICGIIDRYNIVFIERQDYMYNMYDYLCIHTDLYTANKACKALNKYIVNNFSIVGFSKRDLINLINDDEVIIRGLGKGVRAHLKEFVNLK